jgi:Arc/MetJ-type ribon-helix-helix transcriptional regulator
VTVAIKRLYSLRMTNELLDALRALKIRDGISESEAIRRAVADFLKKREIRIHAPAREGAKPKRPT